MSLIIFYIFSPIWRASFASLAWVSFSRFALPLVSVKFNVLSYLGATCTRNNTFHSPRREARLQNELPYWQINISPWYLLEANCCISFWKPIAITEENKLVGKEWKPCWLFCFLLLTPCIYVVVILQYWIGNSVGQSCTIWVLILHKSIVSLWCKNNFRENLQVLITCNIQ